MNHRFFEAHAALAIGFASLALVPLACAASDDVSADGDAGETRVLPDPAEGGCEDACPDAGARLRWNPVEVEGVRALTLTAIRSTGERTWISGTQGFVAYEEDGRWNRASVPTYETIVALAVAPATEVWAAGGGNTVYHLDPALPGDADAGWEASSLLTAESSPSFPRYTRTNDTAVVALTSTGGGDVWAVLLSHDTWSGYHLWHKAPDAGFGLAFGCNAPMPGVMACARYRAAWASPDGVLWLAGERGRTARAEPETMDPNGPTEVETFTNADLNALWGDSERDVWAVGTEGTLLRWSGEAWTLWESPTNVDLYAVWGRSADDVWAVGASGTAIHFDGERWSLTETETTEPLYAVGGASDQTWAGGRGVLLRHRPHAGEGEP